MDSSMGGRSFADKEKQPEESIYQLMSEALSMLGGYAETWLDSSIPALGGRKPSDLLLSDDPEDTRTLYSMLIDLKYPEMHE